MEFKGASSINVEGIARLLRARRELGRYTSLFLGARVGGLFGNQTFYKYLRGYSLLNFNELSETGKFQECYNVLKNHMNEKDTRFILEDSLKNVTYREEDGLLAELVKEGLFDAIISTNIDSLLEETFVLKGMRRPKDYMVLNGLDNNRGRLHLQANCCVMMKVFGDIGSLNYSVPNTDFKLDTRRALNTFLKNTMLHDTLVLGHDTLWDQAIERVFITQEGFCYINEESPVESSIISNTLESHKGRHLIGVSFQNVIRELHNHIIEQPALTASEVGRTTPLPTFDDTVVSPGPLAKKPTPLPMLSERRTIFVSYSHKDSRYLKNFRMYMEQYLRNEQDLLELWDDSKIQVGQRWDAEIKKAMATTRVAVLLISANFLTSEYITKHELPYLLKNAESGALTIVPVIVRRCALQSSPLYYYQAMNSPSLPLSEMKLSERDKIWNRTAERVYNIVMENKA